MIQFVIDGADTVGGLVPLANKLGIRYQSFYSWTRVPAERLRRFSAVTGIPVEKLRPDLAAIFK